MMTNADIDAAISNWHVLNKELKHFDEAECKQAMHRELVGNRRKAIMQRIHTRYCKLRQAREFADLCSALDQPIFVTAMPPLE